MHLQKSSLVSRYLFFLAILFQPVLLFASTFNYNDLDNFNLSKGEYPEIGDPFIKVTIDSIRTNNVYLFPRWVDSVNSKRATVFTKQFVYTTL